jgi:hypothetical protein
MQTDNIEQAIHREIGLSGSILERNLGICFAGRIDTLVENDILLGVNREGRSPSGSRAEPGDAEVSSVGVSAGLRLAGGNIPATMGGTQVCTLLFGTLVRV